MMSALDLGGRSVLWWCHELQLSKGLNMDQYDNDCYSTITPPAMVLDLGAANFRAGVCGDDSPSIEASSVLGVNKEQSASEAAPQGSRRYRSPVSLYDSTSTMRSCSGVKPCVFYDHRVRQVRMDVDGIETIADFCFGSRGGLPSTSTAPLLIVSPNNISPIQRSQILDLAFERLNCPAVYMPRRASMAAFSHGQSCSLVLDVGASMVSCVPVMDGFVMQRPSVEYPVGGDTLDAFLLERLLGPRSLRDLHSVPSAMRLQRVRDVKHSYCARLATSPMKPKQIQAIFGTLSGRNSPSPSPLSSPRSTCAGFNLPDGTDLASLRPPQDFARALPELLFDPSGFTSAANRLSSHVPRGVVPGTSLLPPVNLAGFRGLPKMVMEVVPQIDVDVRQRVCASITITGGQSCIENLPQRLRQCLGPNSGGDTGVSSIPSLARVRLLAAETQAERRASSWLGASILGSLSSFQHLMVTKKEWAEKGASRLAQQGNIASNERMPI
ncbi:actin, putative [Perkinsus marinus ATCC 50983]|uniref:Actin, putative n=1 Tax=Perkinsus marinus (strain ATCC 50983 / TXsc) TaxID=423536 RepID=C5LA40_PERM5|nr:actin, putative [Perkinsus marinus ATCC 50983]EER06296.1 actin, putative [Perkinsus marinus ATCC 50983]|eukprot:XP_002774480.1 actin, putative [Perkinsus marinus ATCC 50983]